MIEQQVLCIYTSWDKTVQVWDAATGREVLTLKGHTDFVKSVAFSPNGKRIASGSYDRTVKLWDAQTGKEALTLKGHSDGVRSVAFSPDGKRIASGSSDKTVKVWDAQTRQLALTLKGHTGYVWSVAFSPDGKRIASGSKDQTVKLWDVKTAVAAEKGKAAEARATAYLKYAGKLIDKGEVKKAKQRLQEILTDYPATKAAAEARSLLDKLKDK